MQYGFDVILTVHRR